MKLSISIMLHPDRMQYLGYLIARLGTVPVAIDQGLGRWDTARRAWELHDQSSEYHLVVQDDALVCSCFRDKAEALLDDPRVATSFYYGRRRNLRAEARRGMKEGRVVADRLRWGVAICLPTALIPEMLEYADRLEIPNTDTRVSRFIQARGMRVVYPLPSLIDHRAGPSLIGDSEGRRAYLFEGE